jgi:tetratricopeptide (TPR) repeat protein
VNSTVTQQKRLQKRFKLLAAARKSGRLDAQGIEALAECAFRLAVQSSTLPHEALRMLRMAYRVDGTNPKYAYHIARICFSHGNFDRASEWLETAVCSYPTSHRLWAHISLLQRELDRRYEGDIRYKPHDLLRRSEEISSRIMRGEDKFTGDLLAFRPSEAETPGARVQQATTGKKPEVNNRKVLPAGATRISGAGKCRWTGIFDISIEQLLELIPSRTNIDDARKMLDFLTGLVAAGRRNASSYSILGIQWLVSGYPPEVIKELRRKTGPADRPSLRLLDLVCTLYDAAEDQLPAAIQENLSEERLPPMLAAVIHQRRLAPPVRFPRAATKLRAARDLLETLGTQMPEDEDKESFVLKRAGELTQALVEIHRQMESRRVEMKEIVVPDRLEELEKLAAELKSQDKSYWDRVKEIEETKQKRALLQVEFDELWAMRTQVEEMAVSIKNALKKLEGIGKARSAGRPAARDRLSRVIKDYQALNLGRFRNKLPQLIGTTTVAVDSAAPLKPDSSPGPPEIVALRKAVSGLESAIDNTYAEAVSSFASYSPRVMAQPPFRALLMSTQARWAETLYRGGRKVAARKLWNNVLCGDRVNINLLKNMAVCDSYSQDTGQTLASWKSYLEMLYFLDNAGGSPKPRAKERAAFHRHFGGAYAPAPLRRPLKPNEQRHTTEGALLDFLNSPSRVRTFVDHKLLEYLNTAMDYSSPPMLLGIRRTDTERAAEEAAKNLKAYCRSACSALPRRISEAFVETVFHQVNAASEACTSRTRLLLKKDPGYFEEEKQHEARIKEICEFKKNLLIVIEGSKELPAQLASLDFLGQLSRLDAVPIDQNTSLLETIALGLRVADISLLIETGERLRDSVMSNILQFIFRGQAGGANERFRQAQYNRLINDWVKRPTLESWLDRIDDPQHFYPEEAITAVKNSDPNAAALNTLRSWCQQYPELTGPARHLAYLLYSKGETAEAIEILEQAKQTGFSEKGRRECTRLLIQLKTSQANVEQDLEPLLEMMETDEADADLAMSVIAVAVNRAKKDGDESCHESIFKSVLAWIERARANNASGRSAAESASPPAEEDIVKVQNSLDEALPQIFLGRFGELDDNTDWLQVATEMDRFLSMYPQNCSGHYWRMVAYNRIYSRIDPSSNAALFQDYCKKADADAVVVNRCSSDLEKRRQAVGLREQLRVYLDRF